MTIEEQVQAEAREMVEGYLLIVWNAADITKWMAVDYAKECALFSINKIISLRVPPMEHYEQIKQAIINYK